MNESFDYRSDGSQLNKSYDPYSEGSDVFAEILSENKDAFRGPSPLQGESPDLYRARMNYERGVEASAVTAKLRKASGYTALTLFLFFIIREGLTVPLGLIGSVISEELFNVLTYVFLIAQYVFAMATVIYLMTLGQKSKPLTFFRTPEVSVWFVAKWTVIAFAVTHATAMLFNIIFEILEQTGLHVNDLSSPIPTGFTQNALYFIAVVICAPIFEELIFRGLLLSKLSRFGGWFAVSVTGVLFGLFHMNHSQIFFATAFGIILGFVDLKAHSVIPSIISHAVFNGYSFLISLAASFTNYEEYSASPETVELTGNASALFIYGLLEFLALALMAVGALLLFIEIVRNRRTFMLPHCTSRMTVSEKSSRFFTHLLMIVYLVIILGYTFVTSFVDVAAIVEEMNALLEAAEQITP